VIAVDGRSDGPFARLGLSPLCVRRFPTASVAPSRQCLVELAFEHEFEEFANPLAQAAFDRIEPVVEKIGSRFGYWLHCASGRAIARPSIRTRARMAL
jgi:hypothetical protein